MSNHTEYYDSEDEDRCTYDEYGEEDCYGDNYYDICYECSGYGDDYYINEDGELVSACLTCPFGQRDDI